MGCLFPNGVLSSSNCHLSLIFNQSLGLSFLKTAMKLSSSASTPTSLKTVAILSFLRLMKQLIVNTPVMLNRCTYDYFIHMQPIPYFLSAHLIHIQPMHIYTLSHIQQMRIYKPQSCPADVVSPNLQLSCTFSRRSSGITKAPVNNLNNPVLLLFRHLVIAWQAEPTAENISPYVDSRALYISICAASTVSLDCDEGVCPVDRLHMHGLLKK